MDAYSAVRENLRALEGEEALLASCRSAHLREAALCLTRGRTLSGIAADQDSFRDGYAECRRAIAPSTATRADILTLCSHIADALSGGRSREYLLQTLCGATRAPSEPLVCYLANPHTDLACELFSTPYSRVRVRYADDFNTVCESVSGGDCDYAILPVMSGVDGRLTRFERLIESYGLVRAGLTRISVVPDIPPDTFALLGRTPELPREPENGARPTLCFTVPADGDIAGILYAADACGLGIRALETVASDGDSRERFSVTLDISSGRLAAFLTLLTLENRGFITTGLYNSPAEKA